MQERWHYVYYSYEEWGRGYIGKRSSRVPPEKDNYFGSFTDKSFKPTCKIILATYDTEQEAIAAEIILHEFYQVDRNPHFANKAKQTSSRFAWRGNVTNLLNPQERFNRRQKWANQFCAGNRGFFYCFFSPTGAIHVTTNLREFCATYKLNRRHVYDVLKGRQMHVQGWTVTKHVAS